MKINPNDPVQGFVDYGFAEEQNKGITIRTQIAALCLQGLLSNDNIGFINLDVDDLARQSVKCADELISRLNYIL